MPGRWIPYLLPVFVTFLAQCTGSEYFCDGKSRPVHTAPPFGSYNFVYDSNKARRDGQALLQDLYPDRPYQDLPPSPLLTAEFCRTLTLPLLHGFSVQLAKKELRHLMQSTVTQDLRYVECDTLAKGDWSFVPYNNAVPLSCPTVLFFGPAFALLFLILLP